MKQNYTCLLFICFFSSLFCNETFEETNKKKINEALVEEVLDNIYKLKCEKPGFPKIKNMIEAKVGYFRPDNETFRDIYSGGAIYELEGTFQAYKNFYPWVSIEYFHKSGKTLNVGSNTTVDLVFIEIGLKYMYPINTHSDSLYLGIGALPSYIHIRNSNQFLINEANKWEIGGVFKGGFLFNYSSRIFFDFFLGYKYLKGSPYRNKDNRLLFFNKIDFSGIITGAGIAFYF